MNKRVLRQKITRTTEGLLNTLSDLVLAQLYFGLASMGASKNSRKIYQAAAEAEELFALTPFSSFKNSLNVLRRKGLVSAARSKAVEPLITKRGQERLRQLFPVYEEKRPWDKKIYLITYDIPQEKNNQRDLLRDKLKDLGCVTLQQSVWVTPYNPRQLLKEFAKNQGLSGQIVISDTGSDGSIGDKSLPETLWELYSLEEINNRYRDFLEYYKIKKHRAEGNAKIAFSFYSILRDDPQLPHELLPAQWYGDEAYLSFVKLTNSNVGAG